MKKLFILLTVVSLVFCMVACSTGTQGSSSVESQTSQQQESDDISSSPTDVPKANNVYSADEVEEAEQISTTVAISNAIIVEDNHDDTVVYKKKCDTCGYTEPGTTVIHPGSIIGSFYCPDCEDNKTVELKTTYSN